MHKVTAAIDCGWVVNPDTANAKVESGIIFGLTAAMYGEIKIKEGRAVRITFLIIRWSEWQLRRKSMHLIESGASIGGLGEPATPPIAAAVTNAVYILTGQRIRELPLSKHNFTEQHAGQRVTGTCPYCNWFAAVFIPHLLRETGLRDHALGNLHGRL